MGQTLAQAVAQQRKATKRRSLLNHPGRNEIMHPVLLVALLTQMRRELDTVPDAPREHSRFSRLRKESHQVKITSVRARVYSCRPAPQKNNSLLPQARRATKWSDSWTNQADFPSCSFVSSVVNFLDLLPDHPRRNEIMHPVLLVAFLAQMSR